MDDRVTYGRTTIYTEAKEITRENVKEVLDKALETHGKNRSDIQYLYDVYRGKMDILMREKEYNAEITNKIVVNYPYRIVNFKTGYELGKPILYIFREGRETDSSAEELILLNDYMDQCGKHTVDISLWEWICIAGVGYRWTEIDETSTEREKTPFFITSCDPRFTFVAYDRTIRHNQVFCCTFFEDKDGKATYYLYTDTRMFTIDPGGNILEEAYIADEQPIEEYYFNNAKMGSFESVLSLANAINRVASNRLDGIEQFIQALMMFKGVNIEAEDWKALKQEGAIVVPPDGDIKYIISELNQSQTQTLLESLYDEMMEIVGLPRRHTGQSAGDNGIAVVYRDGWEEAESHAQADETAFKKSESDFLKLICDICNSRRGLHLRSDDIEIKFTRRNYENLANKSETFATLMSTGWVHPRIAYQITGMVNDPELAYKLGEEYHREMEDADMEELRKADEVVNAEN